MITTEKPPHQRLSGVVRRTIGVSLIENRTVSDQPSLAFDPEVDIFTVVTVHDSAAGNHF